MCGVVLVFFALAGNSFWCFVHMVLIVQLQLCSCVSFLVVAGNSSQNENTFLQKNPMCVFIRPNTLLLCIFLFCIFLLYHTDSHIEVQIRLLLKDK